MVAAGWNGPFENRRHAQRVDTEGTAVVRLLARRIGARVVDLSARGVRLRFAPGVDLGALDGARVVVEIRLDGVRSTWLRFGGTIRRVDASLGEVVIVFWSIPTDFEDLVQDELIAALESDAAPRALLVDTDRHRRSTLARAFGAAGWRVAEVGAPLEALSVLDESKNHFSLIAIADTIPAFIGEEFRAFVADVHPELTNLIMPMPRPRPPQTSGET
jgi:hypothetical protein